jgi:hypothetical protein
MIDRLDDVCESVLELLDEVAEHFARRTDEPATPATSAKRWCDLLNDLRNAREGMCAVIHDLDPDGDRTLLTHLYR